MKHKLYYMRDEHNNPLVTVAIAEVDGKYRRALAIKGPDENGINKEVGRKVAISRLEHGAEYLSRINSHNSLSPRLSLEIVDRIKKVKGKELPCENNILKLIELDATLTEFEKFLLTPSK